MSTFAANLRKAAILIRSVDADTAAGLIAQLTPAEAKAVRSAIQALGPIDPEERADVSAEFRRIGSLATEDQRTGVELNVSAAAASMSAATQLSSASTELETTDGRMAARPFEFLEQARIESLVPYLAREHGQTVAVVLSYLAPARAAQLLAALPERLQADAIERLSVLGDTDPDSLQVLERELADWVARQQATRTRGTPRTDAVGAILAAADQHSRGAILSNVLKHNKQLAQQIAQIPDAPKPTCVEPPRPPQPTPIARPWPKHPPLPRIQIDDLARLDKSALTAVLRAVDAEILVLALAGASEALIDRIVSEMPRSTGKAFRNRLCRMGPTRLSDVEAAQQEVAAVAAQILYARRADRSTLVA